jgi:hypothetical protein
LIGSSFGPACVSASHPGGVASNGIHRNRCVSKSPTTFQNNSQIYDLIYEYRTSAWIINPSFQLTLVPHNPEIGVFRTTWTIGGAIRASYAVTNNFFIVGRTEFIGQNGNTCDGAANLLYGPGSQAWSFALTPTYQYGMFFVRPEFSYVRATNYASGSVFGSSGNHPTQVRGLMEFGVIW